MSIGCLAPITSISGLGFFLNAVLLTCLFMEKHHIALKTILISLSVSDIALSLVLVARTVIPLYLEDNASTSFAAFMFGIYCNMLNVLLMTIERMVTTFCDRTSDCCAKRSCLLVVIAFLWILCIPLAVLLGVFDLYDNIRPYVDAKIVPLSFAAVALITIALHFIMCCRIHNELKRDISFRSLRSLGKGLVITSRKGLTLRQQFRHTGLSFSLIVCYAVFNYPYMIYSFLGVEHSTHCRGSGLGTYNVLVSLLALKTVADPIISLCITVCIPKYWKQIRQHENESST